MKKISKWNRRGGIMLFLFLFVSLSPLSSQGLDGLKVSIHSANKPLHLVLDNLTDQTGYYFTFDSRLADSEKKITLDISNISIQQAIDTLFVRQQLTFEVINKNIVIYRVRDDAPMYNGLQQKERPLKEIKGLIKDNESGKALPYATIAILNTYYGTISNEDGSFVLRVPDTLKHAVLLTSYIGYKNQYTALSLDSEDPLLVSLYKNVISLQEVIIRYQDPVRLLNESLDRIKTNYMNQAAGLQVYYREKVHKDEKCLVFSEAVVEVAKAPYTTSFAAERSRILKGRKITNIDIQDTVILKIRSGLSSMLELDIIKNQPDFLSSDFLMYYDFHFSTVVSFKDKLVYVISFEQKEGIQETLFRGDIYIDQETLAIVAADFEYDPVRIKQERDMFVAKSSKRVKVYPLSAQYHVEYRQTNNAYHLSQVQGDVKFKVRKRRQWIGTRYQINIEMAVTNIDPGNPPDIKFGDQLKPSTIMSDKVFKYDPGFWGDYTTIAPESSLSDALNKIEKSMLEISIPENLEE